MDGTFWALATLLTEYTLDLDLRTARRLSAVERSLPAGSRVAVRLSRPCPLEDVAQLSERLVEHGLRPVVGLPAEWLSGDRSTRRVLRTLTDAGVRDLILDSPASADLGARLSSAVRLLGENPGLAASCDSVGLPVGFGTATDLESARILDLYVHLDAVAAEHTIDAHHLTEVADSAGVVVDLERRLRRAGSRIGLRPTLAVERSAHRLLSAVGLGRRPGSVVCTLLGLAEAMDADRDCLIDRVHLVPGRDLVGTTAWAGALGEGRFYIDDTVSNRLVVL